MQPNANIITALIFWLVGKMLAGIYLIITVGIMAWVGAKAYETTGRWWIGAAVSLWVLVVGLVGRGWISWAFTRILEANIPDDKKNTPE
jgi:hypothetical protein